MYSADLLTIVFSMAFVALCAGLEIALVSSNKLYIELARKQGKWWAKAVAGLVKHPGRVISALLLGGNVALVVYSLVLARVTEPYLHGLLHSNGAVLVVQTILETLLILVVAEFIPKALFRLDANRVMRVFALPLRAIYGFLWLPTMLIHGLSAGILRLFGVRAKPGQVAFTRVDLDEFLKEVSDNSPEHEDMDAEVEYFRNTLELSNTKVRDVMIPRAEIEAIEVDEPANVLHKRFSETGLSKLIVYKDSIDNIIGYVHGNDMFRRPRGVRSVLRPVNFIPGTMPADEVLQLFTKQRTHVAVVVDEFGGTAGMLTIEDVVEVIVGDIEDEHDEGELVEEKIAEHEYALSARLEVAYLKERYSLNFSDDEHYETLAGWIMHHTGDVPSPGTVIEEGPFVVTVANVQHGRIDLVNLKVTDPEKGYVA